MAKLLPYLSDIYIQEGFTHQEVSNIIIGVHDETRGVSVRSVRRFCHEHNIRRGGPLIRKDHLHVAVNHVVNQVSSIGRSTFHEHQTYTKFMLHTIMGIHKYYYLSIQYSHIFQNATRLLWKVNIPSPISNREHLLFVFERWNTQTCKNNGILSIRFFNIGKWNNKCK